jgi:hypothetical protein
VNVEPPKPKPPDLGASFANRKVADDTVEFLAQSKARIYSEVIQRGRWFYVVVVR